jgi:hypothetical protein
MTTIPAGWWLVGTGMPPVAATLVSPAWVVVAFVVAVAAALALRAACHGGRHAV